MRPLTLSLCGVHLTAVLPHLCRFPYMCSIRSSSIGTHLCGATLISPRLAVTAAYCVQPDLAGSHPLLLCGLYDQNDTSPSDGVDSLEAVKVTVHECYQQSTYLNDIAVLELNASAQHAQPVGMIIRPAEFQALSEGYPLTAVGWGLAG